MYFKVGKVDGLNKILDDELAKINSPLKTSPEPAEVKFPFSWACVEHQTKMSQIYVAAEAKFYLPGFWRDGVCLANGSTGDIALLAQAIDYWLRNDVTTEELSERFNFIKPKEEAAVFDSGTEIEYRWNSMLNDRSRANLKSFINLAIKDDVLNQLFPFTSLNTLRFSRCTGYPYDTTNIPVVEPVGDDIFEVRSPDYMRLIGRGTASEALTIVKQNMPPNIGRAIKGTADL